MKKVDVNLLEGSVVSVLPVTTGETGFIGVVLEVKSSVID